VSRKNAPSTEREMLPTEQFAIRVSDSSKELSVLDTLPDWPLYKLVATIFDGGWAKPDLL